MHREGKAVLRVGELQRRVEFGPLKVAFFTAPDDNPLVLVEDRPGS